MLKLWGYGSLRPVGMEMAPGWCRMTKVQQLVRASSEAELEHLTRAVQISNIK